MPSTSSPAERPAPRRLPRRALAALVAASVLVPAAVLAAVLVAGGDGDGDAPPPRAGLTVAGLARTGTAAPDFTLTSLDGDEFTLSRLRGGPVVVNFWASWCRPCREEFPLLKAALAEHGDAFTLLGVVYSDLERDARAFVDEQGATWPALVDPGGDVAQAYGVQGIPQTFFIDEEGVIRDRVFGMTSAADLEEPLSRLLGIEG